MQQPPLINDPYKFKNEFYKTYCNVMQHMNDDNFELYIIDIIKVLMSSYDILVMDSGDNRNLINAKFMENDVEYKLALCLKKINYKRGYFYNSITNDKLHIHDIKNIINTVIELYNLHGAFGIWQYHTEIEQIECGCSDCCCCGWFCDCEDQFYVCCTQDMSYTRENHSVVSVNQNWKTDNHMRDTCETLRVEFTFKKSKINIEQIKSMLQKKYAACGIIGPNNNNVVAVPVIQHEQNTAVAFIPSVASAPIYK